MMNIEEKFIKLTKFLVPYQKEFLLKSHLPEGFQKDIVGNYYIFVGESKTMFTCHLDNYTNILVDVKHVFYEEEGKRMVKTDQKTPLGADDKGGMTIMLNMIEHNVPGCYYFFIGEEKGCIGSHGILEKNKEWFKQFDRCISFDRKGYGSIISRQDYRKCCSREFVEALSSEFQKFGENYKNDPNGVFTDSAVFMDIIPEVTNLSCGGFNEHKVTEYQDLDYLERICNVVLKINWESLPTVRVVDQFAYIGNKLKNLLNFNNFKSKK